MPRRATPRVRVPAGSVGIAGVQTGIYPAETPGGWQLIGRTPLKPFDPSRANPFLFKAGRRGAVLSDRSPRVRRMAVGKRSARSARDGCCSRPRDQAGHADDDPGSRAAGDFRRAACRWPGRWIRVSHRLANALVGNDPRRGDARGHAARPGARVRGRAAGRRRRRRVRADARRAPGAVERAVHRARPDRGCASARAARGARAYLAVAGGIAVPPVLGSRSTHLVSAMGGLDGPRARSRRSSAARRSGAASRRCALGAAGGRWSRCPIATRASACCRARSTTTSPTDALEVLQSAPYAIGQNSDRMGFRLEGPRARARARRRHHLRRDAARRRCRCRRRVSRSC